MKDLGERFPKGTTASWFLGKNLKAEATCRQSLLKSLKLTNLLGLLRATFRTYILNLNCNNQSHVIQLKDLSFSAEDNLIQ